MSSLLRELVVSISLICWRMVQMCLVLRGRRESFCLGNQRKSVTSQTRGPCLNCFFACGMR